MSTTASISYFNNEKNELQTTTIHWDGDLSWTGNILVNAYDTPIKVQELISLGSLSAIGGTPEQSPFVAYLGFDANGVLNHGSDLDGPDDFMNMLEKAHSTAIQLDGLPQNRSQETADPSTFAKLHTTLTSIVNAAFVQVPDEEPNDSYTPTQKLNVFDQAYCLAYGRDRNDPDMKPQIDPLSATDHDWDSFTKEVDDLTDQLWAEYRYVYLNSSDHHGWYVFSQDDDQLEKLMIDKNGVASSLLAMRDELMPPVSERK